MFLAITTPEFLLCQFFIFFFVFFFTPTIMLLTCCQEDQLGKTIFLDRYIFGMHHEYPSYVLVSILL